MPIKPENKKRYPKNWTSEIRPSILDRANHKCELCGIPNYAVGYRNKGAFNPVTGSTTLDLIGEGLISPSTRADHKDSKSICCNLNRNSSEFDDPRKFIVIVLTIMHLDHTPENCSEDNLKAACQRCHLIYDQEHHAINSAKTRRDRIPIIDMFDEVK